MRAISRDYEDMRRRDPKWAKALKTLSSEVYMSEDSNNNDAQQLPTRYVHHHHDSNDVSNVI